MKLDGQVAIIVGGARGIGEAIAHTFFREGASTVLVDLEKMKPQLDGVARGINEHGGKAVAIAADCGYAEGTALRTAKVLLRYSQCGEPGFIDRSAQTYTDLAHFLRDRFPFW